MADHEYYSIKIPINPSRSDINQFASEAVNLFSEDKLHRHFSTAVEKACNRKDTNPDKVRMPFEIMSTYCTVLLDMSVDRKLDERFALEVTLDSYRKSNPSKVFTEEDFKATKSDRGGVVKHLAGKLEDHPLVVRMREEGVWKKPNVKAMSEMVTHIKRTTATFRALEESRSEAQLMADKALKAEIDVVNMKAQYGAITEPERKKEAIQVCKSYSMKQSEVSEYLGIGIATTKRYWNTS